MIIHAIDPGTEQSGFVSYDTDKKDILDKSIINNHELLEHLRRSYYGGSSHLAIEMIASYGMPVGKEVFETCLWIGRFVEAFKNNGNKNLKLIYRRDVKMHLCDKIQGVNDSVIRQALIDLFPATGGGKKPQIGTKGDPGPLYGVKSHMWAALGVAMAYAGGKGEEVGE